MLGVYYIGHKSQANCFSPLLCGGLEDACSTARVMLAVDDVWEHVILWDYVKGVSKEQSATLCFGWTIMGLSLCARLMPFAFKLTPGSVPPPCSA